MSNSTYWQNRAKQLEKATYQDAMQTYYNIEQAIMQAQKEIENNITSWYVRFAKNNNISMAEAKRLLNTDELKEFKWSVQDYIKYGKENAINQNWMKELENASSKYHISRLESLKISTQQSLEKMFGNELDEVDSMVKNTYSNSYYTTMYEVQKGFNVAFNVGTIDENKLSKIASKPWAIDEKNFSERIWGNKTKLINELNNQLTIMCVQGKSPDDAIKYLANKFNVSKSQAGNLVMTESAYFSSLAQEECYSDLNVEQYEIVATLDTKTSEICQEQDGKVYKTADFEAGVTAPPFHNYCRSTTAPYFEDDYDIADTRAAKNADGKTYYVGDDIKYKDWYNKYVDNTESGNVTNSDNSSIILNDDEQYAVNKYIGSDSYKINEKLRNNIELNEDEILLTNNLDSALKKFDYYEGNVVRVLDIKNTDELKQFIERNKVGENINFKEYLSFSDKSGYNNDSNIFIYTQSKKARDIRKYNAEESELLYERNSKFFVEDVVKQEDKYYILWRDINE